MERFYTCEEAAKRYNVKISTIWDWIKKKKLSAIKTGREYRIPEKAFQEFEKTRMTI